MEDNLAMLEDDLEMIKADIDMMEDDLEMMKDDQKHTENIHPYLLNRTSDLQVSYNFGNPRVSSLRSNVCII
jgi:hypothetical protein